MTGGVRHLYVHLPFCAHRCGYCDFVTAVGRRDQHEPYVDALLGELALEGGLLSSSVETVFLGGGTPTFTEPRALERLLRALPLAEETTVEANPETLTAELAELLRRAGVNRVSLGAQSFQPRLLAVSTVLPVQTPFGARSSICVMPDLTTSRSTSSTAFRARAPPISRPTSPTRSSWDRSISPVTSSRRSPGRGSRTLTGRSSRARPKRWRGTSSSSSIG
jgi:hypothetical protein